MPRSSRSFCARVNTWRWGEPIAKFSASLAKKGFAPTSRALEKIVSAFWRKKSISSWVEISNLMELAAQLLKSGACRISFSKTQSLTHKIKGNGNLLRNSSRT